jgi:glycosyltransferase involved in cell wall biosynthesis
VSITILEAMACQLPVIVSEDSVLGERLTDQTGVTYSPGDDGHLAAKMILLLDPRMRETIGGHAWQYIQTYDWQRISQQFLTTIYGAFIPQQQKKLLPAHQPRLDV